MGMILIASTIKMVLTGINKFYALADASQVAVWGAPRADRLAARAPSAASLISPRPCMTLYFPGSPNGVDRSRGALV